MAPDTLFGIGLCAGGCGLELGLEIAIPGYRSVCLVERESSVAGRMAARMQERSLPFAPIWDDVSSFDGSRFRGLVSIVSAGFPCQPFSVAGKRKGTGDERWIWPDIARIIGEVEPGIVFLENVPGLLLDPDSDFDRWEVDGESDDALGGMGTVLRDLAGLGFDAEWCCVRASDAGASHGRKRVFILAYRSGAGGRWAEQSLSASGNGSGRQSGSATDRGSGAMADSSDGLLSKSGRGTIRRNGTGSRGALLEHAGRRSEGRIQSEPERECSGAAVTENASGEMGHSGGSRSIAHDTAGRPWDSTGEPNKDVANPSRSWEYRLDGESGRIGRRGIRASGEQLGTGVGIFAYGPSDTRWQDLLVSRPWLRPSWSQAEAESAFCPLADGMASLVAADRTSALRTLGNGVVAAQAALAFVLLARRAGLYF